MSKIKMSLRNNGFVSVGMSSLIVFAMAISLSHCAKKATVKQDDSAVKEQAEAAAAALQAAEQQIKSLQTEVGSLQQKVADGSATDEDRQKLAKLEADLAAAQGKVEELNTGLTTAQGTIQTQGQALTATTSSLNTLKQAVVLEATHAKADSYRTIEVHFSHDAEATSAGTAANYMLTGENSAHPGAAGISIASVQVVSPKEVKLTTSKRLISMKYELEVKGLTAVNEELEFKEGKLSVIPGGSRMVFVTNAVSNGDLRNLEATKRRSAKGYEVANDVCNAEAAAANLEGKYTAMLNYVGNSNPSYFEKNRMYIRTDALGPIRIGRDSSADGAGAQLSLPIDIKASGEQVAIDPTNLTASLLSHTGYDNMLVERFGDVDYACGGTWARSGEESYIGSIKNRLAGAFLGLGELDCTVEARVTCIQTESASPSKEKAWPVERDSIAYSGDNYIFVTSVQTTGDIEEALIREKGNTGKYGLLAADALCQHLAENAGKSVSSKLSEQTKTSLKSNYSKYRAVLSGELGGDTLSANERFSVDPLNATGSYHLINGIKVTESLEDFFDGSKSLLAPVTMTENGDYLASSNNDDFDEVYENQLVLTGSDMSGDATGDDCGSWTSDSTRPDPLTGKETNTASLGNASDNFFGLNFANPLMGTFYASDACSKNYRLYCAYDKDM